MRSPNGSSLYGPRPSAVQEVTSEQPHSVCEFPGVYASQAVMYGEHDRAQFIPQTGNDRMIPHTRRPNRPVSCYNVGTSQ